MVRGQASLEFLSSYSFAILGLLLVIGGFIYFDATDAFSPRESCRFSDDLSCANFDLVQVDAQTYYFDVEIENPSAETFIVTGLELKAEDAGTYCFTDKIATREGHTTDGRVYRQGGLRTFRFYLEQNIDCDLNAAGLLAAQDQTRFDIQLIYEESTKGLPLVTLGSADVTIGTTDDLPNSSCQPAAVACGTSCLYGVDAGLSGCFIDQNCLFACPVLAPGEEIQRISLDVGTNFISTYIDPTDPSFANIFGPLGTSLIGVYDQSGAQVYPGGSGSLDYTKGYRVEMLSSEELYIIGTPQSGPYTLALESATNYVGVPKGATQNVFESALMLLAQNNLISITDAAGNTISETNNWQDTIGAMQEGHAYEIELNAKPGLDITWPAAYEAYQIIKLDNQDNYVVPALETTMESLDVFAPLYNNPGLVISVYNMTNSSKRIKSPWNTEELGVIERGDLLVIQMAQPGWLVFWGEDKQYELAHFYAGDELQSYVGMPDIKEMDPFRALHLLVEEDYLEEILDVNGNPVVYYDAPTERWINDLGNFTPGNFYHIIHKRPGFAGELVVRQTDECLLQTTCQDSCSASLAYGYGSTECFADAACNTYCDGTPPPPPPPGTCTLSPTCCYGQGYSNGTDCFDTTDLTCSGTPNICTYTQRIIVDQLYEQFSILVNDLDYFNGVGLNMTDMVIKLDLCGRGMVRLTDSYGNEIECGNPNVIIPGPYSTMGGGELQYARPGEGYVLETMAVFNFVLEGEELPASMAITPGQFRFDFAPHLYYVGIPYGLTKTTATALFSSLLVDERSIGAVYNDTGNSYEWDGDEFYDAIRDLYPGEAYSVDVFNRTVLELN